MLLEKMPDPRPYRVQAEVDARLEVKDDQLPLEIAGEDAIGNTHLRCEGEFLLHVTEPHMIVCRSKDITDRVSPTLPSVK